MFYIYLAQAENICLMSEEMSKKSENIKYVLCKGNPLVNYKECMIYKELMKRKFPTLRLKTNTVYRYTRPSCTTSHQSKNYAQVTKLPTRTSSSIQSINFAIPQQYFFEFTELKNMLSSKSFCSLKCRMPMH